VRAKLAATTKPGQGDDSFPVRKLANPRNRLTWTTFISIVTAVFAVEVPFLFLGTPSGHDVEFHLYTWLEVLAQWKQGIIYPRWAALAHFGYGEPRFVFYPPLSWTLGAGLSAIFPWTLVSEVYILLVLVAAGVSMFMLARLWLDRGDATYAAVLYAVNPYHLVIVYWRSAFAELLASALLPLLFLLVWRAEEKGRRVTIFLALVLASAWLVNAPAAVMIHYSLALLMLLLAWQRRSPRILLVGTTAVFLGAALAAFYLLPAIYEQRWANLAQSVSGGSRPLDNFIFANTDDPDHDVFNRLISWIALAEIFITIAVAWMARGWRNRNRELWWSLVAWAGVCAVLVFSVSNPLWNVLPKLRFMQFPWRWLLGLGVPFTLLTALGVRKWTARVALYFATLCLLGFVWHHFQPPWWDTAADLREIHDNVASGAGYEGTDEYTPMGAEPSAIDKDKDARRVSVVGPARAAIQISRWDAEHKLFTANMSAPDNLALRLFNYPAWRVEVNGHSVQTGMREGSGQMLVPVDTGENRVQITFIRTWDRGMGAGISAAAMLLTLILLRNSSSRSPLDY